MKTLLLIFLCYFSFCVLGVSAQPGGDQNPNHLTKFNKVSTLIGMEVRNPKNERLGELKEIAVDLAGERIAYVVIASGGFLGMGDKLLAIPASALKPNLEGGFLVLDADKEALRAAPSFDKSNWPSLADVRGGNENPPNFDTGPLRAGQEIIEAAGAESGRAKEIQSTSQWEHGSNAAQAAQTGSAPLKTIVPQSSNLNRASDLIGAAVKSSNGQKLGDVRDLTLDLKSGKLLYAVLASGGFLGVNEKLLAIPTDALAYSEEKKVAMLNIDPDALRVASGFDENNWPTVANQRLAARRTPNRAGGGFQEASGGQVERANETKKSEVKQSSRPEDVALMKRIERALSDEDSLSSGAKSATVVTANGRVFLSGAVKSSAEKSKVETIARRVAGDENVTSSLKIK
jgi:sporulation protein YlmC with PRC-barrel domain